MELDDVEVEAENGHALRFTKGIITINGGTYTAKNGYVIGPTDNENEDLNLEIEQSIRFDTVETAAKKYGMVKPDSKHTLRYESQDAEYIRQYGKIPKAD